MLSKMLVELSDQEIRLLLKAIDAWRRLPTHRSSLLTLVEASANYYSPREKVQRMKRRRLKTLTARRINEQQTARLRAKFKACLYDEEK